MLRDSLTKLYRATDSSSDPRQMARIVMARQILNAQKAIHHAVEPNAPSGGTLPGRI